MAKITWKQDQHGDWIGDIYRIADDPEQEAYMIIESGRFRKWAGSVYDAKLWCEQDARHLPDQNPQNFGTPLSTLPKILGYDENRPDQP